MLTVSSILILCLTSVYMLGLFADYHWLLSVPTYFAGQVMIAAVFLAIWSALKSRYRMAGLSLLLAVAAFWDTRGAFVEPFRFLPAEAVASQPILSVATYNHYIRNTEFGDFQTWATEVAPDILVLQEVNPTTDRFAEGMRDRFPHQISTGGSGTYHTIVLSRYPIISSDVIRLNGPTLVNYLVHAMLDVPGFDEDVSFYALHASIPLGATRFRQRHWELQRTAEIVSSDPMRLKLLVGDWNMPPSDPRFKSFLKEAGLGAQSYLPFSDSTWPRFMVLPVLKIAIDHVAFSRSFQQIEKTTSPALRADHHAVIARFQKR